MNWKQAPLPSSPLPLSGPLCLSIIFLVDGKAYTRAFIFLLGMQPLEDCKDFFFVKFIKPYPIISDADLNSIRRFPLPDYQKICPLRTPP
jgi:hypothetical protein